jgi:hypothetical protein
MSQHWVFDALERQRARRRAGRSLGGIAAQLNADGVKGKAGGRFYASTISKVLRASAP